MTTATLIDQNGNIAVREDCDRLAGIAMGVAAGIWGKQAGNVDKFACMQVKPLQIHLKFIHNGLWISC
jgi:hypothetical protein